MSPLKKAVQSNRFVCLFVGHENLTFALTLPFHNISSSNFKIVFLIKRGNDAKFMLSKSHLPEFFSYFCIWGWHKFSSSYQFFFTSNSSTFCSADMRQGYTRYTGWLKEALSCGFSIWSSYLLSPAYEIGRGILKWRCPSVLPSVRHLHFLSN